MSPISHSIFFKSFKPDIKWLKWSLRFLGKNWKSDSQIVISTPFDCIDAILALQDTIGKPIKHVVIEQWSDNPYNHQQWVKMMADQYCDGDLITFMDSDAMMLVPCSLEELCEEGRPILWYTEYERISRTESWQASVENVMWLWPKYEFMRRFPLTYHRDTLSSCRGHIECLANGRSIHDMLHERPAYSWSEFNLIGFYAFVFERDRYSWKHTDEIDGVKYRWHEPVRQFHSVAEWTPEVLGYLSESFGPEIQDSGLDDQGRMIKTPIKSQEALIAKILGFITPGAIVVDVGAHEGIHAQAYAGAGAIVHAFEPDLRSFAKLSKGLLEVSKQSLAMPFAIGDKNCTLCVLHQDPNCSEASWISMEPTGGQESDPQVEVIMHTLDSWFASSMKDPLFRIDLIKIDVEGSEPLVLRGAREIIRRYKPIIVAECQYLALHRFGFTQEDITKYLEGYRIEISQTDPRANTRPEEYFYDIIATPN
jgi:FkbM family methyltransferase